MRKSSLAPAVLAGCAAVVAIVASSGRAQSGATDQLHVSSVGGVVAAPELPGEIGQGYAVYSMWCAGCHAGEYRPAGGSGDAAELPIPSRLPLGTNLLQQRYRGRVPAELDQRTDLTPEAIALFVRNGINAMPPFRKTEITDADLAALSAYLTRNSGNE